MSMPSNSGRGINDLLSSGPLDRRALLSRTTAAAALLAAGPVLAACGGSGSTTSDATSSGGSSTTAGGGEVGGTLEIYVWEGYEANVPARKAWAKENGITVDASFITNQAEVIPKLKSPAGEGIDVSFSNVYQIEQFKEAGIVTPITEEEVPNIGNLFPEFTGDLYTDENGDFVAVPYNTGWLGLAYNEDAVGNPNNWDVLFEPEMKGRVGVWDDMITNMQLVSVIHGFDPQKLTQDQLGVVKEWLAKLRPQVRFFATTTGDYMTALANGDVDLVPDGWNATPVFVEGDKPIKTTIPEEGEISGAVGYVDCAIIPPTVDNRPTAAAWINELMGANQVAVETYESIGGGATCEDVPPMLNKATRDLIPYDNLEKMTSVAPFAMQFPTESDEFVTLQEASEAWEAFKAG